MFLLIRTLNLQLFPRRKLIQTSLFWRVTYTLDKRDWAKENFKGPEVVYVLGNHEYYGKSLPKLTNLIKAAAWGSNVHVLDDGKFVMDNIIFLGCTLWTDFKLLGERIFCQRLTLHTWKRLFNKQESNS